jgi:hypothetical protein
MMSPADAAGLIRSRSYLALLAIAAIIGAPISALAYFFLGLVNQLQHWTFTSLPRGLGFAREPIWWPVPLLLLAGLLVGLTIRYLPGRGGHSPVDGLSTMGGGLGICAVRLGRRDVPAPALAVVAAAGSFAAISTLLGSPLIGAFLLMEAVGLGGAALELVLLPGLLAAGVGSLIFVGLNAWTGLGTFSLHIGHLPHLGSPDVGEFGWAIGIGLAAAVLGTAIRQLGRLLRTQTERRLLVATPAAGLAVAGLAVAYAAARCARSCSGCR